ncbi:MAG: anti-sigma factor [Dermatophilaceae bacterium]|nr:anti-sigma factor [Dermatophilaceae bacterium]
MNDDDIHSLSGAYAIDAVDDAERARFEAHLAGCSQCQAEIASLRAAAGELSLTTITAPPPSLRAAVLRDISSIRVLPPEVTSEAAPAPKLVTPSTPSTPSAPASLESKRAERARRAPLLQWLAGAAAAAALATGGLVWHPWSSGTPAVQLTATQQVLHAKDAERFQKKLDAATATIVRSPSLNKAVIITTNLPAAPEGKVYELWLQQGATMVKAGFVPAGPSNTVLLHGNAATAAGAGITIEPAGGSETPTLPPVALISFV